MISKSLGSSRKFHALFQQGGEIGEFCQLLFPLIVVNVDDFGRMAGDAFTVKHVVLPSSPRSESDFVRALDLLAQIGLIERYDVDGETYLQVCRFDEHQSGLHKRTGSNFPEPPASMHTFPGNSGKFPPNRTEENLTEGNLTEGKVATLPARVGSKRPLMEYPRLAIFAWMRDDILSMLGEQAEAFDLDAYLIRLDSSGEVLPAKVWPWLKERVATEAALRGMGPAAAAPSNKRIAGLMAGNQAFLRRMADKKARETA